MGGAEVMDSRGDDSTGPELLLASEVAELLRISDRQVRRLAEADVLGAIDVAPPGSRFRRWRFPRPGVEIFLHERCNDGQSGLSGHWRGAEVLFESSEPED